MTSRKTAIANDLRNKLDSFEREHFALPGINQPASRETFIRQMADSVNRIEFLRYFSLPTTIIEESRRDTTRNTFDPIKAGILYKRDGNLEESCWLVFLSVHFGKNKNSTWGLSQAVYGNLGNGNPWNWDRVTANIAEFRTWLDRNSTQLKQRGSFGNHRKYESLKGTQTPGTGEAVETYINWVRSFGSHAQMIQSFLTQANGDPKTAFKLMYDSLNAVHRFGRTARFDYLTMLGKLGLANIAPDSTYMDGATGPYTGACLLFNGRTNLKSPRVELERKLNELETHLNLDFGMQVLEDAMCNWQKNPNIYRYFYG